MADDGVDDPAGQHRGDDGQHRGEFIETYLAATRDETLRVELIGLVDEFRWRLARWLGKHGAGHTP